MLYQLTQAPTEARIVKQCLREGLKYPKAIANAPTLWLGLALYYDGFWEVSSDRVGMGPIPWSSVLRYAQLFGFSEEQTEDLLYHVRVMDNAYLEHHKPKGAKGGTVWQRLKGLGNSQGA